jgi:hypothetical protein
MASEFIGVVRDAETHNIMAVINPDADIELDNPRWRLLKIVGEPRAVELIKVPRGDYMAAPSMEDLAELIERMSP